MPIFLFFLRIYFLINAGKQAERRRMAAAWAVSYRIFLRDSALAFAVSDTIDTISAAQFIRAGATDWAWQMQQIEPEDGYFWLHLLVPRAIPNLKIVPYPLLYQSNAALVLLCFWPS